VGNKIPKTTGIFDDVWCRSLKHSHFCAKIPQPPNDLHFLIPLLETLPLVTRIYPIEGFLFTSKLSEKFFQTDPRLAGGYILASTAAKKKAGSYSSCRNILLCLLKRLY
jgi:hypothetical protein